MRGTNWVGAAVTAGLVAMTGCGGGEAGKPQGSASTDPLLMELAALEKPVTINIDGSSTVFPAMQAVAEEFQKAVNKKVQINVGLSGTGGGFKKFVRGETDISNASRPIQAAEMIEAKKNGIEYIEIPICFDALTIVVNPKNDWVKDISIDDLKKMWAPESEKKVMKWSDVRPEWPAEDLKLYGAGTDSGTWEYFTEAVNGKAKACRADFTASEDDNTLVQGVVGTKSALAFLPYAYYEPNKDKLKALGVSWSKNKSQDPVLPSAEGVIKGTYAPLSRPLFVYVKKTSAEKKEVKALIHYLLTEGPALFAEVKYVPLPASAYKTLGERFAKGTAGSAFAGHPAVGLPIDDILKREPTLEAAEPEAKK